MRDRGRNPDQGLFDGPDAAMLEEKRRAARRPSTSHCASLLLFVFFSGAALGGLCIFVLLGSERGSVDGQASTVRNPDFTFDFRRKLRRQRGKTHRRADHGDPRSITEKLPMETSPASTEIDEVFYDGYSGRSGFQTAQQSDMNGGQTEETNVAHVTSMCRCPSGQAPFPFYRDIAGNAGHGGLKFDGPGYDTGLVQPRSLATGPPRAFVHHHLSACHCAKDENIAGHTQDQFLKNISPHNFRARCPHLDADVMDRWNQMPDWGVQVSALP